MTADGAPGLLPSAGGASAHDPELETALKAVLRLILEDHPLSANQMLVLAAEVQRLGIHRLVEEHLGRQRRRQGTE